MQLILIGPRKSGKSTVGELLAARLGLPFVSLDNVERAYAEDAGRPRERERQIFDEQGADAWYAYRREFFDEAVIRFLHEHPRGVLELGGGHPILPTAEKQARVSEALAPCPNVVLLLPVPDLVACLTILETRKRPGQEKSNTNELFLRDRRYFELAKHVVYTDGLTPEQTCERILALDLVEPNEL